MFVITKNNGVLITHSNYWETANAQQGYYYLSANAGAFRLLVPDSRIADVAEMKTGQYCEISMSHGHIVLLFEDGTDTPFSITISAAQSDRGGIGLPGKNDLYVYGAGSVVLQKMQVVVR